MPASNPAYDPALYHPTRAAHVLPGPETVDDDALAFYREQGYLAVAHVLSPDEVADEIERVEDLAAGEIDDYDGVQLDQHVADNQAHAASDRVRKLWLSGEEGRRFGLPVDHPTILGIVGRLMSGNTPALFQTMALLKPPRGGGEKPWHQDHAYFDVPLEDRIVGVWIALDAATVANGCMQLLPGQHRDGPVVHFKRRDWQICDANILGQTSVAAELPPGAALFFDSLLPHGTPTNDSEQRRRAMQFHYAPADAASWTPEQRMEIFGSEGRGVSC